MSEIWNYFLITLSQSCGKGLLGACYHFLSAYSEKEEVDERSCKIFQAQNATWLICMETSSETQESSLFCWIKLTLVNGMEQKQETEV